MVIIKSGQSETVAQSALHIIIRSAHDRLIFKRRIRAIIEVLAPMLPAGLLLNVGYGKGTQARYLISVRQDIRTVELEVFLRPEVSIPVTSYDVKNYPFQDRAFSSVILFDTLHHLADQESIFRECLRVSRQGIFIKDHFYRNRLELLLLRALDIGGNIGYGIPSIFTYLN